MKSRKGGARIGDLIPQVHECRMKTFCLMQSVYPIASGLVFSDGRVALVHRSGRVETHDDVDHLARDYCGTASLIWDREERHEGAPRLFVFRRFVDSTGFSGTGIAMEGGQFADGRVLLTWLGPYCSLVQWPSIDQAVTVSGHAGDTTLAWLDESSRAA